MATGNDVINYAKKFVGYSSDIFCKWYGVSRNTAWCNIFVSYVLAHCGVNYAKAAYVPYGLRNALAIGTWVKMSQAQAGDIVVFTWHGGGNNTGTGSQDHIGFIISHNSDGTFTTIEGNTAGSIVAIRRRYAANIYKIVHLNYSGAATVVETPSAPAVSMTLPGTPVNEPVRYVSANNGLNARSGPGISYPVLRTYPKGTPIKVVRRYNNWGYSVGANGWVCTDYLSSTTSGKVSVYSTGRYYVNCAALNVRTGAGTGFRSKGTLKRNTPLKIVKLSGSWGYSNGAGGWVNLGYCRRG